MRFHFFLKQLVFFLLLLLSLHSKGSCLELDPFSSETPWQLEADLLSYNPTAEIIEARGSVTLFRDDDFIQADYARYYMATQWIFLSGNITAQFQGDTFLAERGEFDLKNLNGWLHNGQVFFTDSNIYIKSQELRKTGENTFDFKQATITSCDGEVPVWSFTTEEGDVTIDGYAQFSDSFFAIKDVPVLYTPYMVVPVKTTRQTGFLLPQFGTSSQLGLTTNIPFYIVIDDEHDITLYEYYMQEKGLMQGLEFRHTPFFESKGVWKGDFLYDPKEEPNEIDEDSQFQGDGLVRPHRERFWIRGKYSGYFLEPEWRTEIDIDWVSDQNYLREFSDGYSGYDASRKLFLDEFGRDISEDDDLERENSWLLRRSWDYAGINLKAQYTENLAFFNGNDSMSNDPTVQRLPELTANLYRSQIPWTPLEIEAEFESVYLWRRFGTKGTRVEAYPRISLPLDFSFFKLTPRASLRETMYRIDTFENDALSVNTTDDTQFRTLWDVDVNFFSSIFKVFTLADGPDLLPELSGESTWTKLKHTLSLNADWTYLPNIDQSEFPEFDEKDRISPDNTLTYSLTNLFSRRRETVTASKNEPETLEIVTDYLDFLKIELEQEYDFREATRDDDLEQFSRRPFSDIEADITLQLSQYAALESRSFFSPYIRTFTEHEHMLRLYPHETMKLYFGLDFLREIDDDIRRQDQEQLSVLRLGGELLFMDHWRAAVDWTRDLESDMDLENVYSLQYEHQCYLVKVLFSQTPFEDKIEFKIDLKNLDF